MAKLRFFFFIFWGTFLLAVVVSLISRFLLIFLQLPLAILLLLFIILVGVLFDMIGVAVTAAQLPPFTAKASKKVLGAKEAIYLVKNADRVAIFCNDIVGDVFGTLSGALGAIIVYRIVVVHGVYSTQAVLDLVVVAVIASLTVTGKAVGKMVGITSCHQIIFSCGYFLALFKKLKTR